MTNEAELANKELNERRTKRMNELLKQAKKWNGQTDDIVDLALILEELGSLQAKLKVRNYRFLSKIKSSPIHEDEVKLVKHYLKKTGDGSILICDRNGLCITDEDFGHPLDEAAENHVIPIVHIKENLIDEYIKAVLEWEKENAEEDDF